jgi:hypothetical protein
VWNCAVLTIDFLFRFVRRRATRQAPGVELQCGVRPFTISLLTGARVAAGLGRRCSFFMGGAIEPAI